MINKFIDEVANSGVSSVLPKNLEKQWFIHVFESAVEFLRTIVNNEETDPETFLNHEKGMILLAAAAELIQYRYDYPANFHLASLPRDDLSDLISCYCIAVLIEGAGREGIADIPDIDEDNILEKDFITEIEVNNPEISRYLHEKTSEYYS